MDYDIRRRSLIKRGEGSVNHLYLDSRGNVTAGVGFLIPSAFDALSYKWMVKPSSSLIANQHLVTQEFDRIKDWETGHGVRYYNDFCKLYLPDDEINSKLDQKIAEFEGQIIREFPDYPTFPDNARLAILDMVYNLGMGKLLAPANQRGYPKFCRAVRDQDWKTCADECFRHGIQQSRNDEIKNLFKEVE